MSPNRRARRSRLLPTLAGVLAFVLVAGGSWAGYQRWQSGSDGTTAGSRSTDAQQARSLVASNDTPGGPQTAMLGVTSKDGGFAFKVGTFRKAGRTVGASEAKAGDTFVIVPVAVRNLGTRSGSLLPARQRLHDVVGKGFAPDPGLRAGGADRIWAPIPAGQVVVGALVFEVPRGTRPASLLLRGSTSSLGLRINF